MELSNIEQIIKKVNSKTALFEQSTVVNKYQVQLSDYIYKVKKSDQNLEALGPLNREYDIMKKLNRSLYFRQTEIEKKNAIVGFAGNIQGKFQSSVKALKSGISEFINESRMKLKEELSKYANKSQSQQPNQPNQSQPQARPQQPAQSQSSYDYYSGAGRTKKTEPAQSQPTQPAQSQPTQPAQSQPAQPAQPQPAPSQPAQPAQPAQPQQSQPAQPQPQSEQPENNIDMEYEKSVMEHYRRKTKLLEEFKGEVAKRSSSEAPNYEQLKEKFEQNADLFNDDEIERIETCMENCKFRPDDEDYRAELKEELENDLEHAQARKADEVHEAGFGDVCYAGDSEEAQRRWSMYTNYTQGEGKAEFVTNKNYGAKTSYARYDKNTNCAQIIFDQPVKVGEASGIFFNKDGSKGCLGILNEKEVTAANIKLNNGKVDFSLPENEALLKHPEVVAQIVKLYPDSFKTVPAQIYASDPKLFATMYSEGVKEALNDPAVLGNMEKDEYIAEKMKALKLKTAIIEQNKGFDNVKEAARTVQKGFIDEMSQQMGD